MVVVHTNLGQPEHNHLGRWARKYIKPVGTAVLTSRWISAARGIPLTRNDRALLELKNKHLGETIVILGNGPSLLTHKLSSLANHITIGSNGLVNMVDELGFEPTYFTIKDKVAARELASDTHRLKSAIKLAPWVLRNYLSSSDGFIHYNHESAYPECDKPFSTSFVRRVACGYTVSYANMQLAYYLGAAKVVLVGFDHNYEIPANAAEGDLIYSEGPDPNHVGGSQSVGRYWHVPSISKMESAFRKAREAFEADGREIVNASNGGNLHIFARECFAESLTKPIRK